MAISDKQYQLTFEERPRYLYARLEADSIDRGIALGYIHDLADKCDELNIHRIMLERNIPVMMSDADNYFVVHDMVAILGKRRLAVINPFASNQDALQFGALVGSNLDAPYRVFRTESEAERWLLEE